MQKWKTRAAALLTAGACLALTGCTMVDESVLNTQANYSVDINVPYATATPLPAHLNVPDAIVIDEDGKVSVNDATAIEGSFQNQANAAQQAEYQSLTLGNTGTEVQALQARLQALGYFDGEVSGVYDAATEEAIKRFERTYGTMQTGVATSKLQLKLFAAGAPAYGSKAYENAVVAQYSVLRVGSVGSSVYALQQRLKDLGYPVGELDGVYDEETAACVAQFFTAYGLAASKVASVSMQRQLYAENAKPYNENASMPATLDIAVDETDELDEPDGTDETGGPAEAAGFDDLQAGGEDVDGFAALLEEASRQDASAGEEVAAEANDETGSLHEGSVGPRVLAIQERLAELGYLDESAVNGTYGEDTAEAVDRYLLMQGLASDGELTEEMEARILSGASDDGTAEPQVSESLNVGDSGADVLRMQNRLIELGYAAGTADGKYGPATITALKAFQQINDLEADGVASAETLDALYDPDAITYEEGKDSLPSPAPTVEASDTVFYKLSAGAVGSAVSKLQDRLVDLGFLAEGKESGTFDDDTVKAVKNYQKALGLEQTGTATDSFQIFIYSDAAIKSGEKLSSKTKSYSTLNVGSKGKKVGSLQYRLGICGLMTKSQYKKSKNKYNETTRKCVAKAQKKMGYSVCDGTASPEFQAYLFSKYGKKLK